VPTGESPELRKLRGAFFTPYPIAEHLADWALRGSGNDGVVLDPTCGEGVFLLAAAENLAGSSRAAEGAALFGIDLHGTSLTETQRLLNAVSGAPRHELLTGDFFEEPTPGELGARLPFVDSVIGNPPFIRYHDHRGEQRRRALAAALAQGVRLSGLASSWAALLVHASAFLKPEGRIAMVLPAELLSVGYAEPIRIWLRQRFQSVHLVLFDHLQFADAEEQVVLLVARGRGGCNAFTLHHVSSADELDQLHIYDADAFAPRSHGKWTDLLIPEGARNTFSQVIAEHFVPLRDYATVELGTVTGANKFFALSEATRREYALTEDAHVVRCVPPGSRHLRGLTFTQGQWEQLRLEGSRVWLLNPSVRRAAGGGLDRYLKLGEALGVNDAYKCSIRDPWWKPPVVRAPDLFFTYMSHVSPRLVTNEARTTLVNSMHGVSFHEAVPTEVRNALPILACNSVSRLGAEMFGRAYGGGILKMEPSEAADLPLPAFDAITEAWEQLRPRRAHIDGLLQAGGWDEVSDLVDDALLHKALRLPADRIQALRQALRGQRARRQRKVIDGVE
jgi:adenine-specific DNA-methyltransferase